MQALQPPARSPETQAEIERHAEARKRWPGSTCMIDDCEGRFAFDEGEAQRWCDFFPEELVLTRDELGGKPFQLMDYQSMLVIRPAFGWKYTSFGCGCTNCGGVTERDCRAGLRRFRKIYLSVPKKNGKSPLLSGIGLGLTHIDGEPKAEVYAVAAGREQASVVFDDARDMNVSSQDLNERSETTRYAIMTEDGSVFKVMSSRVNTKHGPRIHGLVFDEFHAQPDRHLYEALSRGVSSRRQPMVVLATTAGSNVESICFEEHEHALKIIEDADRPVVERRVNDDAFLPVIFGASDTDDWTKVETWRKANPGLGVTKRFDYMEQACREAQMDPGKLNSFLQLELNIWTQAHKAWIEISKWDACKDESLRIERNKKGWMVLPKDRIIIPPECQAVGGVDLASKLDLTAFVVIVRRDDRKRDATKVEIKRKDNRGKEIRKAFNIDFGIDIFAWFWIPEVTMHKREAQDRVAYSSWLRRSCIRVTPGEVCDYNVIFDEVTGEILPLFEKAGSPVLEAGFDPANATMFINTLAEKASFRCVEVPQTVTFMSDPAKLLHAMVVDRRVRHDGSPVLRWNVSNVAVKEDRKENIFPHKPSERKRIDGAIGSMIALQRLMALEPPAPEPDAFLVEGA